MPIRIVTACLFLTTLLSSSAVLADADRQEAISREMDCIRQHLDRPSGLTWDDVCYTSSAASDPYSNKNLDMVAQEHDEYYKDYKPAINKGSDTYYTMPQDEYDAYESTGQPLPGKKGVAPLGRNTVSPAPTTYAGPAGGRDYYTATVPLGFANDKAHVFEVGLDSYYYSYKEPGVMEQDGFMYGLYTVYTHRPEHGDSLRNPVVDVFEVDGRFAVGRVDYDSHGTGSIKDEENYMIEVRGTLGKDYFPGPATRMTPYFGFGYRYLNNDSAGMQSTTGHWGYERRSQYMYIPIGIHVAFLPRGSWQVHTNLEYDYFLRGWQDSYLSSVPGHEDVQNEQQDGYGARASVKLVKEGRGMNYVIEPFVRYWNIDDSKVTISQSTAWIEPENETVEAGLKLAVQF